MRRKTSEVVQGPDEPRYLTALEIAQQFKVSRSFVYGLCREGQLEHVKVGRCVRVVESSWRLFLEKMNATAHV